MLYFGTMLFSFVLLLGSVSCDSASTNNEGLCGFVAATDINLVSGYSMWACTSDGVTQSNPCSPEWNGLMCTGSNVSSINLRDIGLTGAIHCYIALSDSTYLVVEVGTFPSAMCNLNALTALDISSNLLFGKILENHLISPFHSTIN